MGLVRLLRIIFYALIVRPFLIFVLGLNVRNLEKLYVSDSARLIAANHNSHLDALVIMSLFKISQIHQVKFVAAKDYFCRTPFLEWFSINIIGIIPIDRNGATKDPLGPVQNAIKEGYTVVIFPEGSRGKPEKRENLKFGVAKLMECNPEMKLTPVFMHGLGKSLPRGEALLVPFICYINIGDEMIWSGNKKTFMEQLEIRFDDLEKEISPKDWK